MTCHNPNMAGRAKSAYLQVSICSCSCFCFYSCSCSCSSSFFCSCSCSCSCSYSCFYSCSCSYSKVSQEVYDTTEKKDKAEDLKVMLAKLGNVDNRKPSMILKKKMNKAYALLACVSTCHECN